ncbi:MAG: N-acetylglucosamine-6-phosphate deacetylase [Clostridia bacterium]|nr:N-acetylglucosamine-6-phosphate deacetylase [Clostridia bacterium]
MQIINGLVLNGETNRFEPLNIQINNGKIASLNTEATNKEVYDAKGKYIISGFIDTHIHGCVGVEFASDNEDFTKAQKWLANEGVTAFAPTVRTMVTERMVAAEKNILRESKKPTDYAKIMGINLEGPFISALKSGSMAPPADMVCDINTMDAFITAGNGFLKLITIAPELENACDVIAYAAQKGVNVSIGHTNATYQESQRAINAGATRATHVFNAMRPLSHRETGVLGAVLTDDRVNCEMICDLVHLEAPAINLVYKSKGFNNITLISDTGAMSGLGDGDYIVNGIVRTVKNGICRNPQGVIAGSCYSMYYGAKNLLKLGIPLEEISVMASLNPAKALGCENIMGSIRAGNCADLIICDKELNIEAVFINGKKV